MPSAVVTVMVMMSAVIFAFSAAAALALGYIAHLLENVQILAVLENEAGGRTKR